MTDPRHYDYPTPAPDFAAAEREAREVVQWVDTGRGYAIRELLARAYLAQAEGMRRLNAEIDDVGHQRDALRAEVASLTARLAAQSALAEERYVEVRLLRAQLDAARAQSNLKVMK